MGLAPSVAEGSVTGESEDSATKNAETVEIGGGSRTLSENDIDSASGSDSNAIVNKRRCSRLSREPKADTKCKSDTKCK